MDMRCGTWNVRILYGRITENSSKRINLDLVAVQKLNWDNGGIEPAGDYTFLYGNRNANDHIGTGFFIRKVQENLMSAVKKVGLLVVVFHI
jgi:hypothetical protein